MKNHQCYCLSPAQDVAYLQCKYSLFKRVINILSSLTFSDDIDYDLMNRSYKLLVERHDCLRIKFFKKRGQLMQYFQDNCTMKDVPLLSFDTKEKQDAFIDKKRLKAINYLRGKVIEPYFIKTYDGRFMVFFKVCHLSLDVYGINCIYQDLLAIYQALKNGTELPPAPGSFEEVIKNDIERTVNQDIVEKHVEYFTNLLTNNPEPFYTGIHGPNNKIWQKQVAKHRRSMPIFLFHNDTSAYRHKIERKTVEKILFYCRNNQCSPANLLFFAASMTLAMLNGNVKNVMPIGLYNCRVSMLEKTCAGTKAQSAGCYTKIDYSASFEDNLKNFSAEQIKLYRHIKFTDRDFETLMSGIYRTPLIEMYYSLAYSLIPFDIPEGVQFDMYSNGKGALPAYVIQFLNSKTNEIDMAYDVQDKTTSEEDVRLFHTYYVNVLEQILNDPHVKVSDIKLYPEQ